MAPRAEGSREAAQLVVFVNGESLLLGGSRRAVRKRKKNLNRERARNVAPDAKKQQEKLGGNQQQPRKRSPSLSENAPGVCGLSESCRGFSTYVFGTFLGTLFLRSASRRVSVSSFVKLLPRFGHVFFAFGSRVSQLFAPVVILKGGKIKRPENVIHRVFSCLLHFLEFGLDVSVTFFSRLVRE